MSYVEDVLNGVTEALAEVGELVTITRSTTTKDPLNQLKTITTTAVYTCMGYVYPKREYVAASASVITRTMFIPDLLTVRNAANQLVNSLSNVVFFTQLNDQITVAGKTYKLLVNEQPRVSGQQVACVHECTS